MLTAADTHSRNVLEERKPDISFFRYGILEPLQIVSVGEIKTFCSGQFTNTHIGQLLKDLGLIIKLQPFRRRVFGFLTDCSFIQFFLQSRDNEDLTFSYFKSPCISLEAGGLFYLTRFLQSYPDDLGHCPPGNKDYEVMSVLGRGRTSDVYLVRNSQPATVMKCFKTNYLPFLQIELENLKQLVDCSNIPKVQFVAKEFLVLFPKGEPVRYFHPQYVRQLINLLCVVHSRGIVHRDIRPSNLLEVNGTIYLIDWGFATVTGSLNTFQGTFHYAADDVLMTKDLSQFRYLPKYDLYSVVRCVFIFAHRYLRKTLDRFTIEDGKRIIEFYDNHMDSTWKKMYEFCENMAYTQLSSYLECVLIEKEKSYQ
eukprot:TRINITY_DN6725_c0_g1_i5.p1 TRINITY_DN6725_c0_g1~~TRINITY_DN6725_c0_g1_i5.p1  ORF type:complete len:367 (-),score=21.89 TRINITY_DN6725_c0_g1_i5:22-1122(-)